MDDLGESENRNRTLLSRMARRPASEADMAFLMQLRRQTMEAHLVASGVSPSEEEHRRRVLARFECAEILLFDGKPSGLLKLARDGNAWTLIQIQLVPELQGQGLGAWLVRNVIAEAQRAGASLELTVLKANPARRLYERLGFVVVGDNAHSYEMRRAADT
jgi:GNAT superfamily N-acetyltransferase